MNFAPYRVTITEGITQVTLSPFPASSASLSALFEELALAQINVDLISQTAPTGGPICLSFTLADDDLARLLPLLGKLRRKMPTLVSGVTSGNIKLVFYGELYPLFPGGAHEIFSLLTDLSLVSKVISTSNEDISVLTDHLVLGEFITEVKSRFQVCPEIL